MEAIGAIPDVLKLALDEVTKNGVSFPKRCDAMEKEWSRSALSCLPAPPDTPSAAPSSRLSEDGRDARAHSAWTTIPPPIECMTKGNF